MRAYRLDDIRALVAIVKEMCGMPSHCDREARKKKNLQLCCDISRARCGGGRSDGGPKGGGHASEGHD